MKRELAWVGLVASVAIATFSAGGLAQVDGSPGTGGTTATGGSGGTGGAIANSRLGSACTSDAVCGAGLRCVTQVGGSVLPGGLCTAPCGNEVDFDAFCGAISTGSLCVTLGTGLNEAYCLQSCTVGNDVSCFAREDAACTELTDGSHTCIPTCNGDVQCTDFTHPFCSGESSWCETAADPGTLPLGARCNPNAAVDECADGACYEYDAAGNGFCSSACRIGTVPQCGWDGTSTTANGLCLLLLDSFASSADLGFCAQLCNTDADCLFPGFICNALSGLSQFGKAGYCFNFDSDGGTSVGIPPVGGTGGSAGTAGTGGIGGISGTGGVGGTSSASGGAGASRDAGTEAGTFSGGSSKGSGCGCRAVGSGSSGSGAWLTLVVGLLACGRRRRIR
jgi:hypothetical protein